ncbi:MAG: hypothetical protein M8357_11990, partial [Desulfobulbaceae bacterium]|nr:hypothetical protein [Desulfobulbaceae bacterium]
RRTPVPFDPDGQPSFMPFRVLLGVAENLQFEEQIFYRQHLRCFGKRQWEKILNSALEGPAKAGPSGLGYLLPEGVLKQFKILIDNFCGVRQRLMGK